MAKFKVTTPNSKGRRPGSVHVNDTKKSGWRLAVEKITGMDLTGGGSVKGPTKSDVPKATVCPSCGSKAFMKGVCAACGHTK